MPRSRSGSTHSTHSSSSSDSFHTAHSSPSSPASGHSSVSFSSLDGFKSHMDGVSHDLGGVSDKMSALHFDTSTFGVVGEGLAGHAGSEVSEMSGHVRSASTSASAASHSVGSMASSYRDTEDGVAGSFRDIHKSRWPDADLPDPKPSPHQPPWGSSPGISDSTHDHVVFGGGKKKNQFGGAHVLGSDIDPGHKPSYTPTPADGVGKYSGSGVNPPGTMPAAGPNGVYHLDDPKVTFPLKPGGKTNEISDKPDGSTMFPQGIPGSGVTGIGKQAYNGGAPNGGFTPGKWGQQEWSGQAQVPYTPAWNKPGTAGYDPSGPEHGSGETNHPNAGDTLNVGGYADQHGNVTSYFPYKDQTRPPAEPPEELD